MDYRRGMGARRSFLAANSAGFTLTEVLITIIIAGILALISAALYQRAARRVALQDEAIIVATRLEQAKALAQSQAAQYRVRFDTTNNEFAAEFFDRPSGSWKLAGEISNRRIKLGKTVSYGLNAAITAGPLGLGTPAQTNEIRFNSRGFPVDTTTVDASASALPRPNNEVYLTDGQNSFSVTVNLLGRVQVWAFDRTNNVWVGVSR